MRGGQGMRQPATHREIQIVPVLVPPRFQPPIRVSLPLQGYKMSIQQKMHFASGILHVDATGEFSLEEAGRAFLEMLEAVVQYQATKVLLDGRTLKGNPEYVERFYYGEFAANETRRLVLEHGIYPRFAYVIAAALRHPARLGELVATNRGMSVKTFETPEEALEWLECDRS